MKRKDFSASCSFRWKAALAFDNVRKARKAQLIAVHWKTVQVMRNLSWIGRPSTLTIESVSVPNVIWVYWVFYPCAHTCFSPHSPPKRVVNTKKKKNCWDFFVRFIPSIESMVPAIARSASPSKLMHPQSYQSVWLWSGRRWLQRLLLHTTATLPIH